MNIKLLGAATAVGLFAAVGTANAAVSVLGTQAWNLTGPLLYGQTIIQDYDNPLAAGFAYVGDNAYTAVAKAYVKSGGHISGETAPPPVLIPGADPNALEPGDIVYESTEYQTVENGGLASIEVLGGRFFTTFSLYMGSPDTYNQISFRLFSGNALLTTLAGDDIWNGGENEDNGDQTWGRRVYYGFDERVTKIEFTSTGGNSFEFDGLAATTAAPEPGTWALMIGGFGMAGATLRRRRPAAG